MSIIQAKDLNDITESEKATSDLLVVTPDGDGRRIAISDVTGMMTVATDSTITGTGIEGSPLSVVSMTGATETTAGTVGIVPAPGAGDQNKVLSGAGTWVEQTGGGGGSASITYDAENETVTMDFT